MIKLLKAYNLHEVYRATYRYNSMINQYRYEYALQSGTYSDHFILFTDAIELINSIQFKSESLQPKDKVAFINSTFPSLILKRLNTDLSRTTKITSSTKLITSCDKLIYKLDDLVRVCAYDEENQKLHYYHNYWRLNIGSDYTIESDLFKDARDHLRTVSNAPLYLMIPISKTVFEQIELVLKGHKFVSTDDLVRYCWKTAQEPTDEEFNGILNLLGSSDKDIQSLGINTLQYYNFSNKLYDLCKYMAEHKLFDNRYRYDNSAWKYVLSIIGTTYWHYSISTEYNGGKSSELVYSMYKHKFAGEKLKIEMKEQIKKSILERIKSLPSVEQDLDFIGCEIVINDKVGETESGD